MIEDKETPTLALGRAVPHNVAPPTLLQPASLGLAVLAPLLLPRCHLALALPLPSLDGSGDLGPEHEAHLSGRITVAVRDVQIRTVFHEDVDERDIATLERKEEGHLAVPVLCVHVGALGE